MDALPSDMIVCKECGALYRPSGRRGPFEARRNPTRIYYKGVYIPLPPLKAALMDMLVRRRFVSNFAVQLVGTTEEAGMRAGDAAIHHLRARLTKFNPELEGCIRTLVGRGYDLHIERKEP